HRDRGACLDERFRCPGTDSPRATGDRDDLPLDATPLAVAGPATCASEAAAQHAALSHPRLLALIGENHTGFCTVSVSIQLTYRVVKIDDRVDPSPCCVSRAPCRGFGGRCCGFGGPCCGFRGVCCGFWVCVW